MRSPLLFLVFNRPESTLRVFEQIRRAKPPRLYIAADGPRTDRAGEAKRCAEVRKVRDLVDWSCEVNTLFQDTNLGCKLGVSTGIDWFFEHESEGVILEDDILPISSFFQYCDELLVRYRDDPRVSMISGCNLVSKYHTGPYSYFFSRYNHIWGWASWRRAWRHYDVQMSDWPEWRETDGLANLSGGNRYFVSYWRAIFDSVHKGEINTWDYQWVFASWRVSAVTILPSINQTENIGFGVDATHTTNETPDFIRDSIVQELKFPLVHPPQVERNSAADAIIDARVFGINAMNQFRRFVRNLPLLGPALSWAKSTITRKIN